MNARAVLRRIRTSVRKLTEADYEVWDGATLPPKSMRLCTGDYKDNNFFLESAETEANRLSQRMGCARHTRVLDIGCGPGRLAIGLIRKLGEVQYYGVDVLPDRIAWCNRHISRFYPSFRFVHVDLYSERYNPRGLPMQGFRFPFPDQDFGIIYLCAVFTNMTGEHMRFLLGEVCRLLKPDGTAFLTAYLEEDVPPYSENPDGYVPFELRGPLNVVRYERDHFRSTVSDHGLQIVSMERLDPRYLACQTGVYLKHTSSL